MDLHEMCQIRFGLRSVKRGFRGWHFDRVPGQRFAFAFVLRSEIEDVPAWLRRESLFTGVKAKIAVRRDGGNDQPVCTGFAETLLKFGEGVGLAQDARSYLPAILQ